MLAGNGKGSAASRWLRRDAGCPAPALDGAAAATIGDALRRSTGGNRAVRDIAVAAAACDAATPAGATVTVDGVCWEHVHSDLYSVYDASYWASAHDGNKEAAKAGRPDPISHISYGILVMAY